MRRALAIAVLALAAAGSLFPAASAELKKEYDRWVSRTWTTENGLPQNTVYALAQTDDGCLWIGSDGGLARFDGTAFTVFKKNATLGLTSDSITSLSPASDGSLWIGTFGGGLVRWLDGKFTRIEGLAEDRIWSLRRDSEGVLWIVSAEGGIHCLERGRSPALAVIDGLPDHRVTAVEGSEKNTLWIGTRGGLAAIRSGKETVFSVRDGLAGDYVYCLFTDSRGSLWVGTTTGLSRIDARGVRRYTIADGLADDLVRAIGEDALGRIWIGTGKGVTVMEPGKQALCATPDALAGDAVMTCCRDREGGMWVGTSAGGLTYLKRNEVRVFGPNDGLSGQQFRSVCEDAGGRLWAGTRDSGLNTLERGEWRSYSRRDGLASDAITALLPDGRDRLWIGTMDAGLQVMEQGKFRSPGLQGGPAGGTILCLFIDHEKNLWIGSDGNGLFRCRNGECEHYGPAMGLRGTAITALGEDRRGRLWAGSAREGLHVLQSGKWRRYTFSDGLAGNTVHAIHADEKDGVWLGTDNGLCLFRQGRFFSFAQAAGPLSGSILAILEDSSGRLWMSSPAGIFSARRSELEDFAVAGGRDAHCRLFGEMSGLKSTVCTGGVQPSAWLGHDGRLWFPTQDGLVEIDPQQLGPLPPPPIPRIERIQADGLTVSLAAPGSFPPGTATFEFQIAAASFADPRQIEFSTRLEGFDEGWSRPDSARSRRIGPLKAGSYVFRVQARGLSGEWNEDGSCFAFAIKPYFHQTSWFPALLLALVGLLTSGWLVHRRRRTLRRLEDKYKSSPLSGEKIAELATRLEQAMEKGKLYLDAGLTLAKLAEATAIPAKQLSQVVNEHFRMNFNDFVNRCRIDEAKRLLLDPATRDFKLLRIAFESGFNSKSVFHAAFRKNTGLSPAEFRRLMGGGA